MILAFTGKIGCGKTTASDYLTQFGFKKLNFKDALVKEMRERLPDVLIELEKTYNLSVDELFKQKPPIMRRLMQNYGTEVRRRDDPNYWVSKWEESAKVSLTGLVVDDCRFLNEYEKVKELGGTVVRIIRPAYIVTDTHIAENEMSNVIADHTIINDDDLDSFLLAVRKIAGV